MFVYSTKFELVLPGNDAEPEASSFPDGVVCMDHGGVIHGIQ